MASQHSRQEISLGKLALRLALAESPGEEVELVNTGAGRGLKSCVGRVGSMDMQKVFGAVETAARREKIIGESVKESHALYHAVFECLLGLLRGQMSLGTAFRTVGLKFSVVRGTRYDHPEEGDWVAVAMYGTVGSPLKGNEHEAAGLGIHHI